MKEKQLFDYAVDVASKLMHLVGPACYQEPTPCDNWNTRELINHMVYELAWVTDLVDGKTIAEVGSKYDGDLIHDDLDSSWQQTANSARAGVLHMRKGNMAHLSYGDVLVENYVNEIGTDILIHSWDLAQALHCSLLINDDIVRLVRERTQPKVDTLVDGGFAAPVETEQGASPIMQLVALFGRPSQKWSTHLGNQNT